MMLIMKKNSEFHVGFYFISLYEFKKGINFSYKDYCGRGNCGRGRNVLII